MATKWQIGGKIRWLLGWLFRSRKVRREQEPEEPKPEEKKSEEGWVEEGELLAEIQDWQGALACFNRALELNPRNNLAWSNKGEVLGKGFGRWEEALACFDRILEIYPGYADAWADKRRALYRLGRSEGERYSDSDVWKGDPVVPPTSFDRALELNPRNADAWKEKGVALAKSGRHEEAQVCFDRAIEINPRDDWAWYKKGDELAELARREEARRHFERALELVDEAVACFDRVRELKPGNEWIKDNKREALSCGRRCYYALACFAPKGKFRVVGVSEWRMNYYGMGVEGDYDTLDEALTIARQNRSEGCWVYDDQGTIRYAQFQGQEERSNAWEFV